MPSIFLSHSWGDKPFVRKLADRLTQEGAFVWLDEAQLNVGDSLIQKISEGIDQTDYVIAVLSTKSINSNWVQKELSLAMTKEINGRKVVVLPLLLEHCNLPAFLKDKLYANLTNPGNFETEFARILRAVGLSQTVAQPKPKSEPPPKATPAKPQFLADSFEDLRIIGVDKSRTNRPDPEMQLYDVYFLLSAHPPNDWDKFFEEERRFPRHSMWRDAWVEGSHIVVRCALDEIQRYHIRDIKVDVENTNKNYREALRRYEAKLERERQQHEDEEKRKNDALDSLDL